MRTILLALLLIFPCWAAREFDGTGDFIVSPTAFNDNAQISVAFWFRIPSGSSNSTNDRIFELGGNDTNDGGIDVEIGGGTQPTIDVRVWPTSNSFANLVNDRSLNFNQWYHAVITSDTTGPSNRYSEDGIFIGNNDNETRGTVQTELTLGAANDAPTTLQSECILAEFGIWHGVILSAAEITALSLGYSPRLISPQNLVGYYPLIGRTSPEIELMAGNDGVVNGNPTAFPHPSMIYPNMPQIITVPAAAAAASVELLGGVELQGGVEIQ